MRPCFRRARRILCFARRTDACDSAGATRERVRRDRGRALTGPRKRRDAGRRRLAGWGRRASQGGRGGDEGGAGSPACLKTAVSHADPRGMVPIGQGPPAPRAPSGRRRRGLAADGRVPPAAVEGTRPSSSDRPSPVAAFSARSRSVSLEPPAPPPPCSSPPRHITPSVPRPPLPPILPTASSSAAPSCFVVLRAPRRADSACSAPRAPSSHASPVLDPDYSRPLSTPPTPLVLSPSAPWMPTRCPSPPPITQKMFVPLSSHHLRTRANRPPRQSSFVDKRPVVPPRLHSTPSLPNIL